MTDSQAQCCHTRIKSTESGQRLTCPDCDTEFVPKDDLEAVQGDNAVEAARKRIGDLEKALGSIGVKATQILDLLEVVGGTLEPVPEEETIVTLHPVSPVGLAGDNWLEEIGRRIEAKQQITEEDLNRLYEAAMRAQQ